MFAPRAGTVTNLDKDGLGVDKLEFCIGMLENLGATYHGQKLTWKSIEPFLAQFSKLDHDDNGRLDSTDLKKIAEEVEARAQLQAAKGFKVRRFSTASRLSSTASSTGDKPDGYRKRVEMNTSLVSPAAPPAASAP